MTTPEFRNRLDALAELVVGRWLNVPHGAEALPEDAQAAFDNAPEGLEGAQTSPSP